MDETPIRRIVILGGGTAGWMTAAALSKAFKARMAEVVVVESDEIGTVGVGEATIPAILDFNRMLGLDEAAFLKDTQATFKLGIEFQDWSGKGRSYIHPFGTYGANLENVSFHHYWLKAQSLGVTHSLEDYSLAIAAAKAGRFRHPSKDPNSILSTFSYAYHFDAGLYAAVLRRFAEAKGVQRMEGKVSQVNLSAEDGYVDSLGLSDGRIVAGDFFIDCSGFSSLILGRALGVGFEDWTHWLPCDRALAVPTQKTGPARPYTRAHAHAAGWQWRIPLQHRIGNGHVYCSAFTDDQAAADTLYAHLEGEPRGDARPIRFTTGRRRQFWHRNCLAVGLAGGFMEPLESTSIHLIQSAVLRFLGMFPLHVRDQTAAREYNAQANLEYAQVRDFLILHYWANGRHGEPFWDHCRAMALPETLTHRIELFMARGRVLHAQELFAELSWVAVFFGQDVMPVRHDPMVGVMPDAEIVFHLDNIRRRMQAAAETMPLMETYIRSIGGQGA